MESTRKTPPRDASTSGKTNRSLQSINKNFRKQNFRMATESIKVCLGLWATVHPMKWALDICDFCHFGVQEQNGSRGLISHKGSREVRSGLTPLPISSPTPAQSRSSLCSRHPSRSHSSKRHPQRHPGLLSFKSWERLAHESAFTLIGQNEVPPEPPPVTGKNGASRSRRPISMAPFF